MAEYTLYCFAQSGNCYKPALMLNLCGADWAARFVDFFNGETRTAEYRAAVNAMGEAPVLEHKGRKLAQSGVILDYLVGRFGKYGWNSEDERREILRWLFWDNHKLTSYTGTLRFFTSLMKGADPGAVEFLRQRARAAMGILDLHLAKNDFAVAGRPTIADLSMCGYLYFNDEFGVDWAKDFPNIGKWLERIKSLKGWVHPYKLMPGHPLPGAKKT
ncbi:MAG: glutathione S-transferase family protein [Rhodospirillales bacterium]